MRWPGATPAPTPPTKPPLPEKVPPLTPDLDVPALQAVEMHQPVLWSGCSCGFVQWTPEHVGVMAARNAFASAQWTAYREATSALVWDDAISYALAIGALTPAARDKLVEASPYRRRT